MCALLKSRRRNDFAAGIVLAAAVGFLAAPECLADEKVERFLPENTFIYVGVEKLGPAFDKALALLQRSPQMKEEASPEQMLRRLGAALQLAGVRDREDFLARTGLDSEGSAGFAWVLTDPSASILNPGEQSFLLILPVKSRVVAERLVTEHWLLAMEASSAQICQEALKRIEMAKSVWLSQQASAQQTVWGGGGGMVVNLGGPQTLKPPAWEDLEKALPGFKKPRCPCGGEYTLGDRQTAPACSIHGKAPGRRGRGAPEPPQPAELPKLQTRLFGPLGELQLAGGRAAGAGYAITPTHIVLSNDMNVLEDAVSAAAGQIPGLKLPPAAASAPTPDLCAFVHLDLIAPGVQRGWAYHPPSPAYYGGYYYPGGFGMKLSAAGARLGNLFRTAGGVAVEAWLGDSARLAARAPAPPSDAGAIQPWLSAPPARCAALDLVPETAVAGFGTDLAVPILSALGDAAMAANPGGGAAPKLAMGGAAGDAAFVFTRAGKEPEVFVNFLFVMRVRDPDLMRPALELWQSVVMRPYFGGTAPIEKIRAGDVEISSLAYAQGQPGFHYAFIGPFCVGGTNLDDVRASIELYSGRAKNSVLVSDAFRKFDAAATPSNLLAFANLPALMDARVAVEYEREMQSQNNQCRSNLQQLSMAMQMLKQQQPNKPLPATLEEVIKSAHWVQAATSCKMFGHDEKLIYDPAAGTVTCPKHGTLADFKIVRIPLTKDRSTVEKVLSALGVGVMQFHSEGGQLKGEGKLEQPAP